MMEMQDSRPLREENARLAAEVCELRERLAVRDGVVKALERTCLLLNTENLELRDAIEHAMQGKAFDIRWPSMKVVFLDIDGVLNNRGCYFAGNVTPGIGRNPDPACVAALNRLTRATGAQIVVSSTWRIAGLVKMIEALKYWGVEAPVIDITPRLRTFKGDICLSQERGHEIQAWLAAREQDVGDVEGFVILDDDTDMVHLAPRLVKTTFEHGLTERHVDHAIRMLAESRLNRQLSSDPAPGPSHPPDGGGESNTSKLGEA